MEWYVLALIAAALMSVRSILDKKVLLKEHSMEYAAVFSLFIAFLTLPQFLYLDYSRLSWGLLLGIYGVCFIGSISLFLTYKVIQHLALSEGLPLLSTEILFTALFAAFFLGERIRGGQAIGILLIIVGCYVLEARHHSTLLEPFRKLLRTKYFKYAFIAMILYGFGGTFDKYFVSVAQLPSLDLLAISHTFHAVNFVIFMSLFHDGMKGIKKGITRYGTWILLISVIALLSRVAYLEAAKLAYISLVIPIKRLSVFFSTLIGGEIFHEHHLLRRTLACLIILIGGLFVIGIL